MCPHSWIDSTISVGFPQQTGGPAITANPQNAIGVVQSPGGLVVADSNNLNGLLVGNTLTEFDVGMVIDYDAPLVPGEYSFVIPVTFTPN